MTASTRFGALSTTLAAILAAAALVLGGTARAQQSAAGDLTFQRGDLNRILSDIKIAERHSAGERLQDILPNHSIPWGLRTVDGSFNNLNPGRENFGRADEPFLNDVMRDFRDADRGTSYNSSASVEDINPRLISHLIVNQSTENPAAVAAAAEEDGENIGPDIAGADQFFIPNTAPDEGLSAPFNAYLTFFGQFFDHGLDLINKGGNGVVRIGVPADDPLFDANAGPDGSFMLMTRATRTMGADGTPEFVNATTPHVDQQQTYASHPSAHMLLRHYEERDGRPVTSGLLLEWFGNDGDLDTADDGGMSTWDTIQLQAEEKLGFDLDDADGKNIPLFVVDYYGEFERGANGYPLLVTGANADGTPITVEGNPAAPVNPTAAGALRVNHNFFIDVAHSANPETGLVPDPDDEVNARTDLLAGQTTRGIRASGPAGTYDDELLGMHYMCGDGRCNENIALTSIHHIFHSEHNRLTDVVKRQVLDFEDLDFLNQWLLTPLAALPNWNGPNSANPTLDFPSSNAALPNQATARAAVNALGLDWDGERVFQAARFGTEMQYNRIVFDEFGPTLSGLKDDFEDFHNSFNPSITSEFSQAVYRFGHSLLTETVDRYDPNFAPIPDQASGNDAQLGLFEAFLNPLALYNFDADGENPTMTPAQAVGAVIRGITRTTANQLDEFVTGAMQNNLIGLPLDLGAINIARGRDVGNPRLNDARRIFYDMTQTEQLKPYISWMDYGDNLIHELSLVNFIAAYGTHPTITGGYADRRLAACAIVGSVTPDPVEYCSGHGFGVPGASPDDSREFLYSQGAWATAIGGKAITGIEDVDFWNGGLAEERQPFGGMLGSTHNFVFENQLERLQSGDRFYYVKRTATMPLFNALESNSFTSLVMRNTDLGEMGAGTMSLNIFSVPNYIWEVDQSLQFNPEFADVVDPTTGLLGTQDPEQESELFGFVIRNPQFRTTNINVPDPTRFLQTTGGDHFTIGGTTGRDTIIGGIGDDSLWGREGDDRIEGGDGADLIEGGPGDDIITDLGGPDVIEGGSGNDAIASGNEEDVVFGDDGNDFIVNSSEFLEGFGGPGDDYIYDGIFLGHIRGGAGNDWMENEGGGEDLFQGDLGAAPEAGEPGTKGHDVMISLDGNNDADMENGDDIVVDGPGIDRVEGQLGFDWVSFQNDPEGVNVELELTIFDRPVLPPSNATVLNRYDRVEGVSGSPLSDIINGTSNKPGSGLGNECVVTDTHNCFDLVDGLQDLIPVAERRPSCQDVGDGLAFPVGTPCITDDPVLGYKQSGWTGGDVMLGGGGSDLLTPKAGNDIIDGDSALQVGINSPNPAIRAGGTLFIAQAAAIEANNNAVAAQAAAAATNATAANTAAAAAATAAADESVAQAAETAAANALSTATSTGVAALNANNAATAAASAAAQAVTDLADAQAAQATAITQALAMDAAIAPLEAAAAAAAATDAAAMTAAASEAQMAADAAAAAMTDSNTAAAAAATAAAAQQAALDAAASSAAAVAVANAAAANAAATAAADMQAAVDAQAAADLAAAAAANAQPSADAAAAAAVVAAAEAAAAQVTADAASVAMAASDAAMQAAADALIAFITGGMGGDFIALLQASVEATAAYDAASVANDAAQAAATAAANAAAVAQAAADAAAVAVATTQAAADQAALDAAAAMALADASAAAVVIADQAAVDAAAAAATAAALLAAADLAAQQTADAAAAALATATLEQAQADAAAAAADLAMAALNAANQAVADAQAAAIGANQAAQDAIAATMAAQAALIAANTANTNAQAAAAAAQVTADNAQAALVAAANAALAARTTADASAAASTAADAAVTQAAADLAAASANLALTGPALAAAATSFNAADATIVAASMRDVRAGVFEGGINPGELSISRVISDHDEANESTDAVSFSGTRSDYVIESDGAGIADVNGDSFIEVADQRTGPTADGRDLVRNTERLVFSDSTVVLAAGVAGSAGAINSLASGQPAINGTPEVGMTLTANLGDVADLDGFDGTKVDFLWESELEPGESGFGPIVRIPGFNDPFEERGDTLVLTVAEAALRVRVVATFQDNEGVFERVVSEAVTVANCPGCPVPEALLGIIPANFLGTAADIDPDSVTFENASRAGLERFDVSVPNLSLDLFANTGFGDPILSADEVLVDSFLLTFTSTADGVMMGEFNAEIVAITDELTLIVNQGAVDVLFSIRGGDAAGLVSGLTSAVLTVNGEEVTRFILFGDSSMNFAQDVLLLTTQAEIDAAAALQVALATGNAAAIALAQAALDEAIAAAVPIEAGPIAAFLGEAGDIDGDTVTLENASRPGLARLDVTVLSVDIDLFGGVDGIDAAFSAGETLGCGPLPEVCIGDEIAVTGFEVVFETTMGTTGAFAAEIVAIANLDGDGLPDGTADQDAVNVLFSIRGDDVTPLVRGLTTVSVQVNGTEVASFTLFGDSSQNFAQDVLNLMTQAQIDAAASLQVAQATGNAATIAAAEAALEAAILEAPVPAEGPTVAFGGVAADIEGDTVLFVNASRPALPRLDITIPAVDIDLFGGVDGLDAAFSAGETPGCGPLPQVCPGDEIAVTGITLSFENPTLGTTGTFEPEIVAIEITDAGGLPTGLADQEAVNVLFSIRGMDVTPLIRDLTAAVLRVGGVEVARETFFGDSSVNDAQDVQNMLTAEQVNAAAALIVAQATGNAAAIAAAEATLADATAVAVATVPLPLEDGVVPASFNGVAGDLGGLSVQFANNSRPALARFDITITDVPLDLFTLPEAFAVGETPGCGAPGDLSIVCIGDEVAVDRFTATFSSGGIVTGVFGIETVQVVAQEILNPVTALPVGASQEVAWVLFSIRGVDMAPLFRNPTTMVTVSLTSANNTAPDTVLAVGVFSGDSSVNDGQNVDTVMLADGALEAVDATDAGSADPIAPGTPDDSDSDSDSTDGVSQVALFTADDRGRIRARGACESGEAEAAELRCSTRRSGSYRCTGRDLAPGQNVLVMCQ